jgi:hypothetical protein
MDPWLLMELDNLRNRLDRLGEDSDEIQGLRDEIESIGNFSLGADPMQAPLYYSTSKIKNKIEDLEGRLRNQDNPDSSEEDDIEEDDEWEDADDELDEDDFGDDEFDGEDDDDY